MRDKDSDGLVEVHVTRDMIHWAMQQTSTQCAIALAVRDADPDGDWVMPDVRQGRIAVSDRRTGQRLVWTDVPKKIQTWIDQFDRDPSKVKPFTFTLDVTAAETRPMARLSVHDAVELAKKRAGLKVETRNQKKIPASSRGGIRHTSKRELRDVVVPENAGDIG